MPIFEFDELENQRTNPLTGEQLCNYWGYSTLGFFAPKAGFSATGRHGTQVYELKQLIKSLHETGIEVVLDVVFNHTAEGGSDGPTISFRGIDNRTYYLLDSQGQYLNYTGCGNTVNCNHPVVRGFVLSCLRYWAAEFHVDGFRFDLASVLGRDSTARRLPARRFSSPWPTIRYSRIAISLPNRGTPADSIRSAIFRRTDVGWSGMANFAMRCGVF
jgi:glycogen operon protein